MAWGDGVELEWGIGMESREREVDRARGTYNAISAGRTFAIVDFAVLHYGEFNVRFLGVSELESLKV
jgi:hypothetical protein